MEWGLIIAVTIIGLTVFMGLVQAVIFPPVEITPPEVPADVAAQLQSTFPQFNPSKILFAKMARMYLFEGEWEQIPCRIKVELTVSGMLDEIEFKRLEGSTRIENRSKTSLSMVPTPVADVINRLFDGNPADINSCRVYVGMIGNETAYEIKFRFESFKYEFEVTESGQLVEFEKEKHHHRKGEVSLS